MLSGSSCSAEFLYDVGGVIENFCNDGGVPRFKKFGVAFEANRSGKM